MVAIVNNMSQYNSKEFKKLKADWYIKLKDSGFDDKEDKHGNLPYLDPKTNSYKSWELTREFYFRLDTYLVNNPDLPIIDRAILQSYTNGMHLIDIAKELGLSRDGVHLYIKKYKKIIKELLIEE